jgi:hypothetical protein
MFFVLTQWSPVPLGVAKMQTLKIKSKQNQDFKPAF